ncbi:SpoIIE family protein phosphatase [Streptomyces kronopolitis]|uniref:SpoIIE family protein phosphatase n=1 Tax=Streptomyces kronopolitis TaxID=1612435 RepID=UPI0034285C9B
MGLVAGDLGPARARERFLHGGPVPGGVRGPILDSWQRSRSLGLSPDGCELPYRQDIDLDGRLVRAAGPVLDRLQARFAGRNMNVCLADGHGAVLQRRFGEASLVRRLAAIQSVPGFVFAEQFAGTNGIGLALAERQLINVYGAEHFAERSQTNACAAIPVRDPLSGRIEGVLCFGYPPADADADLNTVISRAAGAIEQRLLTQSSLRERALLQAYLDARGRAAAGGATGNGEPAGTGLDWRDELMLKERAADLIASGQRAAVEVTLPGGRRITLLSRPVTSPSGVAGFVIEAVLPGPHAHLAVLTDVGTPPGGPAAEARTLTPPPPGHGAGAAPGRPVATAGAPSTAGSTGPAPGAAAGPVVLIGEPGVGSYAVAARRRLELLSEASTRIGTALDVSRTARELAEMAVPRLADYVTIDLPEAVLRGEEPTDLRTGLHRTVVHGIHPDHPFYPAGEPVALLPTTPQIRCLTNRQPVLEADLPAARDWIAQDAPHARHILGHGIHSLIAVPLLARGIALGIASFYRAQDPAPFGDDDRSLAQELATRAAICIDNARRFTREHTMVLALQHSLLPQRFPEQSAVEVAHRYLPAASGVGGDWFDVIPLSGTRVALVVGDVVGHGLHAAATMGRLRTAARNFAELDLPPDEVLTQLDKLVARLDRDEGTEDPAADSPGIIGASCLYAIYDPTSQMCVTARSGHPPPALVHPDGTVSIPDLPAGPPLGLGGLPFETAAFPLPEGSQLVLYTDGLLADRHRDVDTSLDRLRRALSHPDRSPEDTCEEVVGTVVPPHPDDDIALLVARTRALDRRRIATWALPADPSLVSGIRAAVTRQLAAWGLEEAVFTTELLLSELVTNAVRYGTAPLQVRLLHDRNLICEVSDASSTAPHLRHAASTDEGGRGLFLVAQLAQAWGTRYTPGGKVIWAECALEAPGGKAAAERFFDDIPAL